MPSDAPSRLESGYDILRRGINHSNQEGAVSVWADGPDVAARQAVRQVLTPND